MPDGFPDLWQGYAPDEPKMPTIPWPVRTGSHKEACLCFSIGKLIFFLLCAWLNTGLLLTYNHHICTAHSVRMQACIRNCQWSLRCPNNSCSNVFEDTNMLQLLGTSWSAFMSGTPSLVLGLEHGLLHDKFAAGDTSHCCEVWTDESMKSWMSNNIIFQYVGHVNFKTK